MTFIKDTFGNDMRGFDKFFVGFDDHLNKLSKIQEDFTKSIPNYPPYNIKKTGENTYSIELAVAGFSKSEVEIELDGDKMFIRGTTKEDTDDYIFKGIASRAFTRTFVLADQIEVKNAEMLNGMLRIFLEKVIPEDKKPKKVTIK